MRVHQQPQSARYLQRGGRGGRGRGLGASAAVSQVPTGRVGGCVEGIDGHSYRTSTYREVRGDEGFSTLHGGEAEEGASAAPALECRIFWHSLVSWGTTRA